MPRTRSIACGRVRYDSTTPTDIVRPRLKRRAVGLGENRSSSEAILIRSGTKLTADLIDRYNLGGEKLGANVKGAKTIGGAAAKAALDKGIKEVVFDRGGARYHGKVKALADAAREAGLKF